METIRAHSEDLAQKILDEMFVFENLLDLDDRSIQLLLKEIDTNSLVVALKGTSEALKEKIFKNISKRAADLLREDLEAMGPVRLSDVEGAQQEIVNVAKRLETEGKIMISRGGDGDALVERHHVTRERATAGVARAAEPRRVYLGPAREVIERAHRIPHLGARRRVAAARPVPSPVAISACVHALALAELHRIEH